MQGTISFDGTLSGGITGGGGGGSDVTITPTLQSGTKIADYTINSEGGSLYAPESVEDVQLNTSYPSEYSSIVEDGIAKLNLYPYAQKTQVANDIDEVLTELRAVELDVNSLVAHFPDKQDKLTAGQNITIDQNNVISAIGGSGWNYSTTEVNTGQKWTDGKDIYCKVFNISPLTMSTGGNWYPTGCVIPNIDKLINVMCSGGGDTYYGSITADYSNDNINLINFRIAIVDTITAFYTKST